MLIRTGIGYDVHAFKEGRKLVLGGVVIPFNKGLDGHSDADVLLHAICDALLGAANLGDIGKLFPDNNVKYKSIDSSLLLKEVGISLKEKGYVVSNIDTVVILQKPKISHYISAMQERIAAVLLLDKEQISIKATTTEYLGFEGKEEGAAAMATCLITKENT